MKKWLLYKKTLNLLGLDRSDVRDTTVESISDDFTVNLKKGDINFSGNPDTLIVDTTADDFVDTFNIIQKEVNINVKKVIDNDSTTTGSIVVVGMDVVGEFDVNVGDSKQLLIENEDGATLDCSNFNLVLTTSANVSILESGVITSTGVVEEGDNITLTITDKTDDTVSVEFNIICLA
jgi:hypothetical protein